MHRQIRPRAISGATVTLQYVQTIRRGDRVYHYLRLPGKPRLRLPDLPIDHPDFLAAYADAVKTAPTRLRAASGTIAAMIEGLRRHHSYASLSPDYRRVIARHLDAIAEQADDARAIDLRARDIADDLAALPPNVARARRKAWRLLCAYGLATGYLQIDPSDTVKAPPAPKTDGHPPWASAEIEAFRARYQIGTVARAAMELLFWTGARVSDAVAIGPQHVGQDGVLAFRQQKTGGMAYIPWTCALPGFAAAYGADRDLMHAAIEGLRGQLCFLPAGGRRRSIKGLSNVISDAARAIGIEKSAHGLRKSRAAALAEGGASTHQIAAWTGHTSLSEVQHYTDSVNRRRAVTGTEQDRNFVKQADLSVKQ